MRKILFWTTVVVAPGGFVLLAHKIFTRRTDIKNFVKKQLQKVRSVR